MTPTSPTPSEGDDSRSFKIFALSGYKGSGKTTAAGMLQAISNGSLAIRSFATPLKSILTKMNPIIDPESGTRLKEALRQHGELHVKEYFPEYRRLMQGMNTIKDWDTHFYARIGAEAAGNLVAGGHFKGVVFDDMRFPSELGQLESLTGTPRWIGVEVELVTIRLGLPVSEEGRQDMHITETALDRHETDYTVVAESLADLKADLTDIHKEVMNVTK